MGIILSRFRKKSSSQLLESVDKKIKELEVFCVDAKLRQKKISRQLMVYSSGISLLISILLYFYTPPKFETKLILGVILLLSPLIYLFALRAIGFYYEREIKSSQSRLDDLKKEKKKLIDEIMDKETYKVAKEILQKYAPEALPREYPSLPAGVLPRGSNPPSGRMNLPMLSSRKANGSEPAIGAAAHIPSFSRPALQPPGAGVAPKAFPAMPQNPASKGYMERILESIIGDGPNNRYALICSSCATHNGMALMEEFEYTAFKCYACQNFNPARKLRPSPPKLDFAKSDQENGEPDSDSGPSSDECENEGVKVEEMADDEEEGKVDNHTGETESWEMTEPTGASAPVDDSEEVKEEEEEAGRREEETRRGSGVSEGVDHERSVEPPKKSVKENDDFTS